MKKFLKIFGIAVLVLLIGGILLFRSLSLSMPQGEQGAKADELAGKMLNSLSYQNYKDLEVISWKFRGGNHYVWDKKKRSVLASFDGAKVMLNFSNKTHDILVSNELKGEDLINAAIANFYNDSFWVVAPFKIMDKGVTREYVETDDGPGLLVTYNSGGVTPGDSYLWVLDANYRPKYWRIWTSNVRIKGMKFKWKNWDQYKGVWFAQSHPAQIPFNVRISDLKVE